MRSDVKRTTSRKRRYDASRRREQAAQTRDRILEAARGLFVANGYGRTTMADIARAAGVATETVYAAFRTKANLLHHVWYATFRGDDEDVRLLHRPEIQQLLAEPDLPTRLRRHAEVMTPVLRRSAPLLKALEAAAASEPAAADMVTELDDMRLDAYRQLARAAAETGQLAVPEEECADVLYAALDGRLWQRLVVQRGWTDDRFAGWLGELLVRQLVGQPRDQSKMPL